tara:strand:+ start:19072 stop:20064 length:993 start_codon:yes stop_codon:yes gene_type:complete
MRVLIVKLSAFGDILSTSPIFKSIRSKSEILDHLVIEDYKVITEQNVNVDDTLCIKKNKVSLRFFLSLFKVFLQIRKKRYDVCFLFHRSVMLYFFLKVCGVGKMFGFTMKYKNLAIQTINYNVDKNRTLQEYDILNLVFKDIPYPKKLDFYIDNSKVKINKPDGDYITLAIGGGNIHSDIHNRAWPIEKYLNMMNSLFHKKILILGNGKYDQDILQNKKLPDNVINLINKTNINETAHLIKGSSCFISHDMGLIHLAAALDTKIVGIYGPTDPKLAQPLSNDFTAITSEYFCSPCYNPLDGKNGRMYLCQDNQCMKTIKSEEVVRVINKT